MEVGVATVSPVSCGTSHIAATVIPVTRLCLVMTLLIVTPVADITVSLFPEAPGEDGLGPLQPVPPRKPGTMGGGARPKFEVNYSSEVDWSQRHEKGERRTTRPSAHAR